MRVFHLGNLWGAEENSPMFDSVHWQSLFAIDTPLLEIFVRGTCMYLGLFLMLRFILNRQTGSVGITDILLIVLIADAAQNGMADDYDSITDGLLLVATIIFWNWLLDYLSYHFKFINRLINPKEVALIHNGKILQKNLAREMITEEELMSHLRGKGVDDIRQVKTACMESGGEISVVTYHRPRAVPTKKQTPGAG